MRPFVLDIETSISNGPHGPDFRDPSNDIFTVIAGKTPQSIQVIHKKEGFGRKLPLEQELKECDLIVGHNLSFDLSYVWGDEAVKDFFTRGGRVWDTQVAEYILTAQQHQYSSLEELQEKYLGQKKKPTKIGLLYKKGVGADKILAKKDICPRIWKEYEKYCYLDGATTLEIFKKQYIRAKKEGMLPIIQLYQDYLVGLIDTTCTGIVLDISLCEKTRTRFSLLALEHLERAQKTVAPLWRDKRLPPFNINSSQHRSAVLFGGEIKNKVNTKVGKYKNGRDKWKYVQHKIWVDGFQVPKKCSKEGAVKGFYSTDKKLVLPKIKAIAKDNRLLAYIEEQQRSVEFADGVKVIDNLLKYQVGGKIYPNFNNVDVVTGRLSSSRPNMQNITKKTEIGKDLHRLFVAPDNCKCVQGDFSQLEIWVSALLSQDVQLIKDLQSGLDMHCMRVANMSGCTYEHAFNMCKVEEDPEWTKKRTAAKTFSYQRAYGCGLRKLVEYTGLDELTLKTLIEAEEKHYPKASNLWRQVGESIKDTTRFSLAANKPSKQKTYANTYKEFNLMQLFDKSGSVYYNREHIEKIGFWSSLTGKKYHFAYTGNHTKFGFKESVSPTVMKNYPMQGTAADIQGATTAEILPLLLKHSDKIKMINEVHDSKWFYIKEEYLSQILPVLRDKIEDVGAIFNKRFGINVPFKFPIDIEVGDNFAEMTNQREEDNEEDSKNI